MTDNIKVAVRVRPVSVTQGADPNSRNIVRCIEQSLIIDPTDCNARHRAGRRNRMQQFHFDTVFGPGTTQQDVFEKAVEPLLPDLFKGINAAVLAYGATGSGKTHTMLGTEFSAPGVVIQTADYLFAQLQSPEWQGKQVRIAMAYFEIYNENIRDLLATASTMPTLDLREGEDGSSIVAGLSTKHPTTRQEFIDIVSAGVSRRFQAATKANAASSRSHAVLEISVEIKESETDDTMTVGKLKLCDLAGSERAASTANMGLRLREGAKINRSLLALGAVVQALSTKGAKFVPYRGSKLTRVLRDCLGGNCKTLFLTTISSVSEALEETLNTLQYASKARTISSSVSANMMKVGVDLQTYEHAMCKLQKENAELKEQLAELLANKRTSAVPMMRFSTGSNGTHVTENACQTSGAFVAADAEGDAATFVPRPSTAEFGCTAEGPEPPAQLDAFMTDALSRLQDISALRQDLMGQLRSLDEGRQKEIETDIRSEFVKIAKYEWNRAIEDPTTGPATSNAHPVGINAAYAKIADLQKEAQENLVRREKVYAELKRADDLLQSINAELLQAPHSTPITKRIVELMYSNLSIRQSCSEAEQLAAFYSQKARFVQEIADQKTHCISLFETAFAKMKGEHDGFSAKTATTCLLAHAWARMMNAPTNSMITALKDTLARDAPVYTVCPPEERHTVTFDTFEREPASLAPRPRLSSVDRADDGPKALSSVSTNIDKAHAGDKKSRLRTPLRKVVTPFAAAQAQNQQQAFARSHTAMPVMTSGGKGAATPGKALHKNPAALDGPLSVAKTPLSQLCQPKHINASSKKGKENTKMMRF